MADRTVKDGTAKPAPAKARPSAERKFVAKAPAAPAPAPVKPPFADRPVAAQKVEAPALTAATTPAAIVAPIAEAIAAAPTPEKIIEAVAAKSETTITEGNKIMETTATKTIEAGQAATQQAQAAFGDINDRAKGMMEKNAKIVQEMSELTKGNVEAYVESSRVAAKAFETISRDAADYSRRSFEEASTALKSFAEVRSPADLFRLQSEFARSAFDQMVAESSKMSETVIKLAGEVAEPLTSRYSVAADRVKALAS